MIRSKYISEDKHQTTALHEIDCEHFMLIVNMLLLYGADINSQDSTGNTVLHVILLNENISSKEAIVQFLLEDCHANFLCIKNNDGRTPWELVRPIRNSSVYNIMKWKQIQQIYTSLLLCNHPTDLLRQ
jgi:ankyrin repeat protein